MNKKAIFDAVEITVYVVITVIVAVFIAVVAVNYKNEEISTTQLETFLLQKKLTNTCLVYSDNTGIKSYIIDINKLTSEILSQCYTKEGFGYSVKILEFNNTVIKEASNLNLRQKANMQICENVPKHECFKKRILVNFYSNEEIHTGFMDMEVINLVE